MRARAVTRLVACAFVLCAAMLLAQGTSGEAARSASKVVDHTMVCTTGIHGGARVIYLRAQSAYGRGQTLDWLAQASVSAVGQPVPTKPDYRPTLAGMSAGWPPPRPLTAGGIGFDNRLCKAARSRVALSTRGLSGGIASQLGDELTCVVPKTMLVRVRVAFGSPVELELKRRFYSAVGRVQRGQIAVTTTAGKRLVYAEVTESRGASRLFTSGGCA
jgi:hypothetical protein